MGTCQRERAMILGAGNMHTCRSTRKCSLITTARQNNSNCHYNKHVGIRNILSFTFWELPTHRRAPAIIPLFWLAGPVGIPSLLDSHMWGHQCVPVHLSLKVFHNVMPSPRGQDGNRET